MYEHAIQYYLHALKCESIDTIHILYTNYVLDEVHGDKAKASVRGQCDKYLVRTEELQIYIRKKRASKMVEGGGSSIKSKKK